MTERFVDAYLPDEVPGWPCLSSPLWSTQITRVDSGDEQANRRWAHPLYRFRLPEAVRDMSTLNAVRDHWLVLAGPFSTWPFRDPSDFASVDLTENNVAPTLSSADQTLGTGDGVTTAFQLIRTYTATNSYARTITIPVVSSVLIEVNGVDPTTLSPAITWSVSRPGGLVTFSSPITAGHVVKAGYLFDNEVRYESDDAFDAIAQQAGIGGFADMTFIGVRRCS